MLSILIFIFRLAGVIETVEINPEGVETTTRYLKGCLLGKGAFAKWYKLTDLATKQVIVTLKIFIYSLELLIFT